MNADVYTYSPITKEWKLHPEFNLRDDDNEALLLDGPFGVVSVTVSYDDLGEVKYTKPGKADPR